MRERMREIDGQREQVGQSLCGVQTGAQQRATLEPIQGRTAHVTGEARVNDVRQQEIQQLNQAISQESRQLIDAVRHNGNMTIEAFQQLRREMERNQERLRALMSRGEIGR